MEYELFYLVGASKQAELERIKTEVHKLVEDLGGTWLPKLVTEERRLAYEIKHETRGTYVAQRFTLPKVDDTADDDAEEPEAHPIAVLTKQLNLSSDVLRFIIIRADELPPLLTREERKVAALAASGKGQTEEEIDKKLEEVLNI